MPKYRKKPVVIDAVQFDGSNFNEIYRWAVIHNKSERKFFESRRDNTMGILTKEGMMTANQGDYIIRRVNGEFYPCKPDIFETTYEKVDEQESFSDGSGC